MFLIKSFYMLDAGRNLYSILVSGNFDSGFNWWDDPIIFLQSVWYPPLKCQLILKTTWLVQQCHLHWIRFFELTKRYQHFRTVLQPSQQLPTSSCLLQMWPSPISEVSILFLDSKLWVMVEINYVFYSSILLSICVDLGIYLLCNNIGSIRFPSVIRKFYLMQCSVKLDVLIWNSNQVFIIISQVT